MSEFSLPEGWVRTQLGDAIDYGKCEKAEPSSIDEDTWVLELEDVEKESSKVTQFLTFADRQSKSTKNKFKKGDVLYGKLRPYLNKVVMANNDGVCTTEIIPLNGGKLVNNKFIFYWLKTADFLTYVTAVGYGVNMPRLGTEDGKAAPFVFAPLAEQQQIAQKLDELLSQVDTLKTRLDAIPNILKRFRQSVLAAAVSGRLTEEWRGKNKQEKITLPEIFSLDSKYIFSVPSCWSLTAIGNVTSFQQGLQIAKETRRIATDENVLPILRTVNYENNFAEDVHYALVDEKSIIAEPEDIILSRTGTVGRVLTGFKGIMHNNSFRLNYKKNCLFRKYLICFLKSPICQEYVKENSGRSTQPDLTHKAFAKCPISIPNLEEQTEIVRRIEQLFAYADQIEQCVKDAQARVNHLTQSVLAKAFRGELTADWRVQNPELISGENSAAALLERIKVEREVAVKSKRKKKV